MKVKKLTLQAFGPYSGRTEIDFSLLGDGGIYIITGATGSGKTSIFDGISFALYGRASGEERTFEDMRCSYADSSVDTFVSLDFEHMGKAYSVKRSPRYERAKTRGSGTTVQNATASLVLPDGAAVTGDGKVTAKICEIIGLDREQYARTAMIAQGDFYKILYASTAERVEIFRKIFSTGKYGELQKRLFECAKAAENEAALLRGAIEEKTVAVLGKDADLTDLLSRKEDVKKSFDLGVEEWKKAKENIASLTKARDELKNLLAAEDTYYKTAAQLKSVEEQKKTLLAERSIAESALKELKGREDERADAAAFVMSGEAKRGLYVRRDGLKEKISSLQREIISLSESEKRLSSLIEKQKESRDEYKAEYAKLENSRAEKVDLAHKKSEAERELKDIAEAEKMFSDLEAVKKVAVMHAKRFKCAEESRAALSAEYERGYSAFLKNQAGILAEGLDEGTPCPVCGAVHHPNKATREVGAPDGEKLKELKEKKENAEKLASGLSETTGKIRSEFEAMAKTCAAAIQKISGAEGFRYAEIPTFLTEAKDKAEEKLKTLSEKYLAAEKDEKRYTELADIISDCEKFINSYTADKEKSAVKRSAVENEKAKSDGELSAITTDFADLKTFDGVLRQKEAFVIFFDKAKKEAEEKLSSCSASISSLEGRKKALEEALSSLQKPSGEAEEKLKTAEKEMDELTEKKEVIRAENREKKAALDFLEEKIPEYEKAIENLQITRSLSDLANGSIAGKSKIKIETFVQMRCFDRVLYRANIRLENMTGGQYTLVRRESSSASSTGLELDIIDNYKLTQREVGTLSGGESFLASLALALGLSDEVQSSKGGVRIDSMFLDEGFGTLSDEALNGAVNTLSSLSDGRVSIGVISHVKELERRIDKKIIVEKSPSGSTVRIET